MRHDTVSVDCGESGQWFLGCGGRHAEQCSNVRSEDVGSLNTALELIYDQIRDDGWSESLNVSFVGMTRNRFEVPSQRRLCIWLISNMRGPGNVKSYIGSTVRYLSSKFNCPRFGIERVIWTAKAQWLQSSSIEELEPGQQVQSDVDDGRWLTF
jgi:hypothetical protein